MTNADKFKSVFGVYATELWSMSEKNFLKWLNSEVMNCSEIPNNSDTISRQDAIDAVEFGITYAKAIDVNTGDSKELFKEGNDALRKAVERLKDLPSAEPKTPQNGSITCVKPEKMHDRTMGDLVSRQDAIDAVDSETVSTNPEHFKSSEKFIMFMDDVDIASFGKWQWANGFNTALVATRVQLKKLPSAEPERKVGKWTEDNACEFCGFQPWYEHDIHTLSFCPNCGADMRGEQE